VQLENPSNLSLPPAPLLQDKESIPTAAADRPTSPTVSARFAPSNTGTSEEIGAPSTTKVASECVQLELHTPQVEQVPRSVRPSTVGKGLDPTVTPHVPAPPTFTEATSTLHSQRQDITESKAIHPNLPSPKSEQSSAVGNGKDPCTLDVDYPSKAKECKPKNLRVFGRRKKKRHGTSLSTTSW